ncbi:MAG TPA: hypothetical protein VFU31_25115 [Candidatus Binatia bacterium]|nr:hypothetical protein [Candidatus Binatia bacterium]
MKAKNVLVVSLLVVLTGLIGGCHELASDDYSDYSNASGSYRDGFRDGRAYERRREDRRDSRYDDRGDYYRRRW